MNDRYETQDHGSPDSPVEPELRPICWRDDVQNKGCGIQQRPKYPPNMSRSETDISESNPAKETEGECPSDPQGMDNLPSLVFCGSNMLLISPQFLVS
jgi:hypothetical protein